MYQTKEDILKKWETTETKAEAREIDQLRKDISKARGVIAEALTQYRKKKLKAKSKKQAEENPFEDLKGYDRKIDILDAYGYGCITEHEKDRLEELWDLREQSGRNSTKYTDRVTEMLERAMDSVGDLYVDQLFEYDMKVRRMHKEAEKTARENNERTFQREHGVIQ